LEKKEFSPGWRLMPNTTVFLLDIMDSNSLHGPVRELHQDNGISNQINLYYLGLLPGAPTQPKPSQWKARRKRWT
jgi:hypothetical protein